MTKSKPMKGLNKKAHPEEGHTSIHRKLKSAYISNIIFNEYEGSIQPDTL
jgi:hypothetical protein